MKVLTLRLVGHGESGNILNTRQFYWCKIKLDMLFYFSDIMLSKINQISVMKHVKLVTKPTARTEY